MQLASLTQKRHVFVVMSISLKVALCFYKQYSFMETQQQIILNLNPIIKKTVFFYINSTRNTASLYLFI